MNKSPQFYTAHLSSTLFGLHTFISSHFVTSVSQSSTLTLC